MRGFMVSLSNHEAGLHPYSTTFGTT
jgi:hypothetical protein